ncbi:hypothetical protein CEXT_305351 [Caerostris extrusa]|uniref:Uncharacterized protein n=1 Tax=Caerostris extrusa TaxID=172846 RepID=A0AAV4MZA2_CAEEX|nr:hypothetical protein CEXT_305351 [Caerostris extrusa]
MSTLGAVSPKFPIESNEESKKYPDVAQGKDNSNLRWHHWRILAIKRKQGTPETHFSVKKENLHKRNKEKAAAGDNERVFFQEKSAANGEEREVSLFEGRMAVFDHVRGFHHQEIIRDSSKTRNASFSRNESDIEFKRRKWNFCRCTIK